MLKFSDDITIMKESEIILKRFWEQKTGEKKRFKYENEPKEIKNPSLYQRK